MKRAFHMSGLAVLWLTAAVPGGAQVTVGNTGTSYVTSAPAGTCNPSSSPLTIVRPAGTMYTCQSGTWASVGSTSGTPTESSWFSYMWATLASVASYSQLTPVNAITVDRVEVVLSVQPAGCTTNAVVALQDSTANSVLYSFTITPTQIYDSGATPLAISVPAQHALRVRTITASAGCTTTGQVGSFVVQYH
jgi:hypothetical protein